MIQEHRAYVHDRTLDVGIFVRSIQKTGFGFAVDVLWFNIKTGSLLETDDFVIRNADIDSWKEFEWENRLRE